MSEDAKNKFANRDLEYPKLELMIIKRGIVRMPAGEPSMEEEVLCYIDGAEGCEPCLTIRLDNLGKGEYYVLYRPDFKPWHIVKRLNIVLYSEYQPYRSEAEVRLLQKEREVMMKQMDAKKQRRNGASAASLPGG